MTKWLSGNVSRFDATDPGSTPGLGKTVHLIGTSAHTTQRSMVPYTGMVKTRDGKPLARVPFMARDTIFWARYRSNRSTTIDSSIKEFSQFKELSKTLTFILYPDVTSFDKMNLPQFNWLGIEEFEMQLIAF
ncbi:hypothetical protein TNCV_4649051 [Trichonephila clavipes]|uniref:Uncharacterized protein n=1 Tax=Trichonephila clavipes TaxID=2585209 RepID=A0A8X6VRM0_TRICX|nr:hypothetical protein TNCV_4649051 [Trichonephila clavipes]